jgi:lysophospholipase L1-like esterase
MSSNDKLAEYALSDIQHMKIHGRTTGELSPLALFWTASGMEWNARGSELWVEVEVDYAAYEPWISLLVNHVPVSRQMLPAGRYWIPVFRGMGMDTVKNIRIVKDVQAMSGDPGHSLLVHAVKFDGEFLPIEDKQHRFEFIGDSITSGEGAIGAKAEADWISMWFSAVHNYSAMTAAAFNADYRVISQSGWGVLTSWDNNPHASIPRYYGQVCGLLTGEKNEALGALRPNDFDAWQPDVVVVNLGTNDGSAFNTPEWRDPATGTAHKQRMNADGTYDQEDLQMFMDAIEQFLAKLRGHNGQAHIVWAYGMLGLPMLPAIQQAVGAYKDRTGDSRVSICVLPNTTEESVGARTHPGVLAHERAADALTAHIRGILEA